MYIGFPRSNRDQIRMEGYGRWAPNKKTGRLALVLQYVEGRTLDAQLEGGPLPLEDACRIGAQAAEALETVHAKGWVHRDVKPGNILIAGKGAYLSDFGICTESGCRTSLS